MRRWLLCGLTVLSATVASANFVISPGLSYISDEVTQSTPSGINSTSRETRADIRLGYILPMGLYLGGMYSHIGTSANDSATGNLMGATIGYFSNGTGFYTLFTYHLMGEMGLGGNTTLTGAQGPQLDVGWVFPITSTFSIGPQLTWRSIEYSDFEAGAVSVDSDYKRDSIAPYVSLWFMF